MKFEYKQFILNSPISRPLIDALGEESWELVGLGSFNQTEVNRYLIYVFKRPKGPDYEVLQKS